MAEAGTFGLPSVKVSGDVQDPAMRDALVNLANQVQFWLRQIVNHMDEQRGNRGTPSFVANVQMQNNRICGLGIPVLSDDAQTLGNSLSRSGEVFDAQNRSIINLPEGSGPSDAVNLDQLQTELAGSGDFVRRDGTLSLTGGWDAGSFEIQAQTFQSDIATGTAPLTVASMTVVTNLNADTVDGIEAAALALLAGRSSGQTLIGGTASGEDLTLQSTSNATRGSIFLGSAASSAYDEVNDRLGVGIAVPESTVHAHTATAGSVTASTDADDIVVENSSDAGISILAPDANLGIVRFGSPTDNTGAVIYWDFTNKLMFIGTTESGATADLVFITGNTSEAVRILQSGNVGIGDSAPGAGLTMGDDKLIARDVNAELTASTTQTQGGGLALTAEVNEISTCANADDTVVLPTAVAGLKIVLLNNGVQQMRIFPASADNLGAGVDTADATALAAGSNRVYVAYDATNWEII